MLFFQCYEVFSRHIAVFTSYRLNRKTIVLCGEGLGFLFTAKNSFCYCELIILGPSLSCFVHVLYLQFIAVLPLGLTNMKTMIFSVLVVRNLYLVLRLSWCEQGSVRLSLSLTEAHWSSLLHNNASQSVNNYASSPVKDRPQSCSPCLSEKIQ